MSRTGTLAASLAAVALAVSLAGPVMADDPALAFLRSGQLVARRSLADLERALPARTIEFVDPMYGHAKRYRAFALRDVLALVYGPGWRQPPLTEAVFEALDGYTSVAALDKLDEDGGFLVYRDLDAPGWEPIGYHRASPGPFYLVWTKPGQTPEHEYPWPWQIASIDVMRFEERYPAVYPAGAPEGSPALRGYEIFKGRCVRCHAMSGQGGKVGPDLDAPRNIITYRSADMVKAFIRQPSRFRHTQMPDHPDLSDAQLDDLVQYFWYKSRQHAQ